MEFAKSFHEVCLVVFFDPFNQLPKLSSDPVTAQNQPSGWKVLLGLAVGVGIILLGAMAGINLPTGDLGSSRGSGHSTS